MKDVSLIYLKNRKVNKDMKYKVEVIRNVRSSRIVEVEAVNASKAKHQALDLVRDCKGHEDSFTLESIKTIAKSAHKV